MKTGTVTRALLAGAAAMGLVWSAGAAVAQSAPRVTQPAQSQSAAPPAAPTAPRILDELKVGLVAHDVGFLGKHKEGGIDTNLEVLFASPDIFRYILRPRPHIGAEINSHGHTSHYYAGLTWGGVFWEPGWSRGDGFFAYFSESGSVNDGKISTRQPNRKQLGSHVLFREGVDIGYRFNDVLNIAAYIDHISNARLANRNEGITSVGARFGYRF